MGSGVLPLAMATRPAKPPRDLASAGRLSRTAPRGPSAPGLDPGGRPGPIAEGLQRWVAAPGGRKRVVCFECFVCLWRRGLPPDGPRLAPGHSLRLRLALRA